MFSLAFLIGIYSYLIFCLGLLGLLYKNNIIILTSVYIIFSLYLLRNDVSGFKFKRLPLNMPLVSIVLLIFINLVGALGPELGFDALWYHLTLPKIYLINHKILDIPGGLFYYSNMPKLIEMLYTAGISLGGEIIAKLIHFWFGILSMVALYGVSRKFFSSNLSLIVCLIFYSSLVVDWMSITAYIDLGRTFYEIMALWAFLNYLKTSKKIWLAEALFMLGFAISAKLLAIGSVFIFGVLFLVFRKKITGNSIIMFMIPFLTSLPWFTFSFLNTGNPIYPLLTTYQMDLSSSLLNPINFFTEVFSVFTRSSDPINPLLIVLIPLLIFIPKRFDRLEKAVFIYSIIAVIVWYFTPRTGGGRFILPYIPAFSIISVKAFAELSKFKTFRQPLYALVISIAMISIFYRGLANAKYIPYLLGKETKSQFLSNNLNFKYGDFYDTDGYIGKTIKSNDVALLYGFHNLYYVDFPFIDSSYVKVGDKFNFIVTQNMKIPDRFKFWKEIYSNPKTGVKLYTFQNKTWLY